jgi:hypothetical protein
MMPAEQSPEQTPPPVVAAPEPVTPPPPPPRQYRWYHKATAVLFITLCLDIGLILLIGPWTDYWENFAAYVSLHAAAWRPYVDNLYARGGISGLGVVNLYISLGEVFGLRRFSRH